MFTFFKTVHLERLNQKKKKLYKLSMTYFSFRRSRAFCGISDLVMSILGFDIVEDRQMDLQWKNT